MAHCVQHFALLASTICLALQAPQANAQPSAGLGNPPPGFTSAVAQVRGTSMHFVRGGNGPVVILVHGFPENWTEYRAIMPRLAERFTVVAVDLPGIGESGPAAGGYDAANLASHIHALAASLKLDRPYVAGHDLGGVVTYALARRYPESLRGAMILDVPIPGIAGWDEAVADKWHIGFIQVPGLAESMVPGRQEALLGHFLSVGKFSVEQRAYYFKIYDAPQLHAAFEIYRGFPADAEWNKAQAAPNRLPLTVAVGEKSFFSRYLATFVDGFGAKGMTNVTSATIPNASHYVLADNPEAVARLIEQHAGRDLR